MASGARLGPQGESAGNRGISCLFCEGTNSGPPKVPLSQGSIRELWPGVGSFPALSLLPDNSLSKCPCNISVSKPQDQHTPRVDDIALSWGVQFPFLQLGDSASSLTWNSGACSLPPGPPGLSLSLWGFVPGLPTPTARPARSFQPGASHSLSWLLLLPHEDGKARVRLSVCL